MILPLLALFGVAALASQGQKKKGATTARELVEQARDEIESSFPPGYVADQVRPQDPQS